MKNLFIFLLLIFSVACMAQQKGVMTQATKDSLGQVDFAQFGGMYWGTYPTKQGYLKATKTRKKKPSHPVRKVKKPRGFVVHGTPITCTGIITDGGGSFSSVVIGTGLSYGGTLTVSDTAKKPCYRCPKIEEDGGGYVGGGPTIGLGDLGHWETVGLFLPVYKDTLEIDANKIHFLKINGEVYRIRIDVSIDRPDQPPYSRENPILDVPLRLQSDQLRSSLLNITQTRSSEVLVLGADGKWKKIIPY